MDTDTYASIRINSNDLAAVSTRNVQAGPLKAKNDGTTDDWAAIQALIDGADQGGRVFLPASTSPTASYRCSRAPELTRAVTLEGEGSNGNNTSTISVDQPPAIVRHQHEVGCGIIAHSMASNPLGVDTKNPRIKHLSVRMSKITIADWVGSHATVLGERRRFPASVAALSPDMGDDRLAYHLVCTRAGTTGATFPTNYTTIPGPVAFPWAAGVERVRGDYVRRTASPDRSWRALNDGVSGTTEPMWPASPAVGDTIVDGTGDTAVVWRAMAADSTAAPDSFEDGGVRWTCVCAPGIFAMQSVAVEDVCIVNATDNGIHIQASSLPGPWPGNANGASLEHVFVQSCGGHGWFIRGYDANTVTVLHCSADSCGGWGGLDSSAYGSRFIACQEDACVRGPYKSTGAGAMSELIACYSENGSPPSQWKGLVLGGFHGPGFTAASKGVRINQTGAENWTVYNRQGSVELRSYSGGPEADEFGGFQDTSELWGHAVKNDAPTRGWKGLVHNHGEEQIAVSGARAVEGYGRLWLTDGFYEGRPVDGTVPFRSHTQEFAVTDRVRGGYRVKGDSMPSPPADIVPGGWARRIVVVPGYVGPAWTASRAVLRAFPAAPGNGAGAQIASTYASTTHGAICTRDGTTGTTAPTMPSATGPAANAWYPAWYMPAGTYGHPPVRNGHIYLWSGGVNGSVAPTFPTGAGSTVADGAGTWTEAGSDAHIFDDGTAEWACVGPVPEWRGTCAIEE